jgi:hypothetical protein
LDPGYSVAEPFSVLQFRQAAATPGTRLLHITAGPPGVFYAFFSSDLL